MNTNRPRHIQIDYNLFLQMSAYVTNHFDPEDPDSQSILLGIRDKFASMERRDLYSAYKSAPSAAAREMAREEYLSMMGIPESFRWPAEQDLNVNRISSPAQQENSCSENSVADVNDVG